MWRMAHAARVLAVDPSHETLAKLPKIQESGPTGGRGDGFGLVSQKQCCDKTYRLTGIGIAFYNPLY
jgi:hypothetical protein